MSIALSLVKGYRIAFHNLHNSNIGINPRLNRGLHSCFIRSSLAHKLNYKTAKGLAND